MRIVETGILFMLLAGCGGTDEKPAAGQAEPAPLFIEYSNAGFETVVYRDGVLELTWHTPKDPGPVEKQDPSSFERREFKGRLAPEQVAFLWDWVKGQRVFELKEPDFSGAARTYASIFKSKLRVETADRKVNLSWTAEDSWPYRDPRDACKLLIDLCKRFAADAEQKTPRG